MAEVTNVNIVNNTSRATAASYLQKIKYQKQWIRFCQKYDIKNTNLIISDWQFDMAATGGGTSVNAQSNAVAFYNAKLGVKLRMSIPRQLLLFIPLVGWGIYIYLVVKYGVLSFIKMRTGSLVKVQE